MWLDGKGSAVLDVPECKRLLAMAAKLALIGRVGIATDQAPVIIPVNFSVEDGQVSLRLGIGFLSNAAAHQLVAFEVDHVDRESGVAWSVLVRGLASVADRPEGVEQVARARPLVPQPGDLTLTIRPDVLTGRQFILRSPSS